MKRPSGPGLEGRGLCGGWLFGEAEVCGEYREVDDVDVAVAVHVAAGEGGVA